MGLFERSPEGEPSDAELISRVRGGDGDAYGLLFSRHVDAGRRLARSLVRGPDADDLVSEAFTKVLNVLRGGGGPDLAFRAYLLTSIRRIHVDRLRGQHRAVPTDDLGALDDGVPFRDTVVEGFEGGAAARAFASLPERWQMVLWHLEVEEQKPAEIAPLLGMSPNAVSALAYRAREGLRQAFLQMHAADLVDEHCARTHELLGAYVRHGLSRRDNERVERHLRECRRCTALYLELTEVNSSLAGLLAPLVLGAAATAYLTGGGASSLAGLGLVAGRVRDVVAGNAQAVLVTVGVAGVAGAATVAGILAHHGPGSVVADPGGSTTTPTASARQHTGGRDGVRRGQQQPGDAQNPPTTGATGDAPLLVVPTPTGAPGATIAVPPPVPRSPGAVVVPPGTPSSAAPGAVPPASSARPASSAPPASSGPAPAATPSPAPSDPGTSPGGAPPPSSPAPSSPDTPAGPTPVDVVLSAKLSLSPPSVQVVLAGVPAGQQVTVVVSPLSKSGQKESGPRVRRIDLGSGTTPLDVEGIGHGFVVEVSVPSGYDDPDPSNNAPVRLLP